MEPSSVHLSTVPSSNEISKCLRGGGGVAIVAESIGNLAFECISGN